MVLATTQGWGCIVLARHGLVLLSLLAAACAASPDDGPRAALDQAFSSARASLAATGAGTVLPAVALVGPAAWRQGQAGTPVPGHVQDMIGQPAQSVRALFGDPGLRRREGAMEVWLYNGRTCRLDVMLYPDQGSGEPRVAFAAARATGLTPVAETACLRQIVSSPTTLAARSRGGRQQPDRF